MEVDRHGSPTAALPITLLGVVLTVGGATAYAALAGARSLALIAIGVGTLHLAVAAVLSRHSIAGFLGSRRGRVGVNVTLMSLLAITLWLIVNAISTRNYVLHDLTADRKFSISAQTTAILRELDESEQTVRATILYRANPFLGPFLDRTVDLLETYAAATDSLEVERIDVEFEPDRADLFVRRFRDVPPTAQDGAVAFESGDNRRLLTMDELISEPTAGTAFGFRGEEAFTSAIVTVTESRRKKVLFVTGHDEAGFDSDSELDANIWVQELRRLNVDVGTLELPTARRIPDGTDMLVIIRPNPEAQFPDRELRMIERYVDRGGNLMVMVEPQTPDQLALGLAPALPKWLARYGALMPEGEILVDPPGAIGAIPIAFLTREFGDHQISRELGALMLPMQMARPVLPEFDNTKGFTPIVLISTSSDGWSESTIDLDSLQRPEFDPARDRRGPVPIAVAMESSASGARVVAIGDANTGLDIGMSAFPSRAFVLNCSNWLLRREQLVSLPAQPLAERRLMELSRAQKSRIFWLTVVGLPLVVLTTGMFVAIRRRK